MELERKNNNKFSTLNPTCIKEVNSNSINLFDTSFKSKKSNSNCFKEATKLKRNFK